MTFAMDKCFYNRLATIYQDPARAAQWLAKRTHKERKAKGMEIPKLCDENMEAIE